MPAGRMGWSIQNSAGACTYRGLFVHVTLDLPLSGAMLSVSLWEHADTPPTDGEGHGSTPLCNYSAMQSKSHHSTNTR